MDIFDTAEKEMDVFDMAETQPISTITSKPIPTGPERIQQTGQAWRTMGPIVGDIAGTAAMEALPIPGSGALWGVGKRAVGSGFGSLVGSLAGQKMAGGPVSMKEAGVEGAIGAMGEPALTVAGAPIKWAARKVAKPALELASDLTMTGTGIKRKMRDNLIKKTTQRATDFVNDLAPDIVKRQEGGAKGLGFMVDSAIDETRTVYDLYEVALKEHAKEQGGKILLDDTAQALGDIVEGLRSKTPGKTDAYYVNAAIREFGHTPTSPSGRLLKSLMEGDGSAPPDAVADMLATVFKGFKNDLKSTRSQKQSLKDAVMSDLDKMDATGALKRQADQMFKDVKRFDLIKKVYDSAIQKNRATGEAVIQPMALHDAIYKKRKVIQDQMPDLWPKLKAEADYYANMAPHFAKQESARSGALGYAGGVVGPGLATWAMGPAGIPVAEAFGAASAYALMSPTARARIAKVISATAKSTGKAALHLGGKPIFMEDAPAHEVGQW